MPKTRFTLRVNLELTGIIDELPLKPEAMQLLANDVLGGVEDILRQKTAFNVNLVGPFTFNSIPAIFPLTENSI